MNAMLTHVFHLFMTYKPRTLQRCSWAPFTSLEALLQPSLPTPYPIVCIGLDFRDDLGAASSLELPYRVLVE
jgi:hypothetical protein